MKMVPILRRRCYWLLALALTGLFGCGGGGGGSSSGGDPPTIPISTSSIQPTNVTENSAILSWTDNSDNEDGFQIGTCSGSTNVDAIGTYCAEGFSLLYTTINPFYELTGLDPNTTYTYYVRAYNSVGASNAYRVQFTTAVGGGGVTIPLAPSEIIATQVTTDSATLSWTDNSDNEDGFQIGTCSGIEASDAGGTYCETGWVFVAQTTNNFYELSGLTQSSDYVYYVRSSNSAGSSKAYRVAFTTFDIVNVVTFIADFDNTLKDFLPHAASPTTDDLGVGCIWEEDGANVVSGLCTASLVYFDLSSLAGATIESATLRLNVAYLAGVGTIPRNWQVTPVDETIWDESVTWNISVNDLAYRTADSIDFAPPNAQGQMYAIDVTTFAQNWLSGSWSNNGMILELTDYSPPATVPGGLSEDGWGFFSHDFNVDLGPRLTVVYR